MAFFFFFDKDIAIENFSRGFNAFLDRKNLKVKTVSKELNLSYSAVSFWKNGRGFPDFQTLSKLFEMGMTLKEMFGERLANIIIENGFAMNDDCFDSTEFREAKLDLLNDQKNKSPVAGGERLDGIENEIRELKAEIENLKNQKNK